MTKKLFILALFISSAMLVATAQNFNPDVARKSLVKVLVTANNKAGTCSGFIWKQNNWVVTSLHAMKPGGKVQVQYLGKGYLTAKIIRVNKEADLVLLEVIGADAAKIPDGIVPLKAYSIQKISFDEPIYAVGYNSGSEGSPTRSMKKGDLKPKETLEYLVPPTDLEKIKKSGLPSATLDIIYIDGSLLPGYSGSPVYDKAGSLVGIGNGGLEGGASNVSWVIPAKYLSDLENSSVTQLPADFASIAQHFSAEVEITTESTDPYAIEQQFAEEYASFEGGDFFFYYTKTRTLEEMYNSSYDPYNIDNIVNEFVQYNLNIDYNVLSYDIYEDAMNGIVVAIPEGLPFDYDEASNLFYTDMANFPQGYYFSLRFEGVHDHLANQPIETTADILIANVNQALGTNVGGYYLETEYSYSQILDNRSSIAYIMLIGNNTFYNADGINVAALLYITLLQDDTQAFYSIAELYVPVEAFNYATTYGIDCLNNYAAMADYCDYFESYMQIMCAVHLTTFANKQNFSKR